MRCSCIQSGRHQKALPSALCAHKECGQGPHAPWPWMAATRLTCLARRSMAAVLRASQCEAAAARGWLFSAARHGDTTPSVRRRAARTAGIENATRRHDDAADAAAAMAMAMPPSMLTPAASARSPSLSYYSRPRALAPRSSSTVAAGRPRLPSWRRECARPWPKAQHIAAVACRGQGCYFRR
jgi:hypothetical protein